MKQRQFHFLLFFFLISFFTFNVFSQGVFNRVNVHVEGSWQYGAVAEQGFALLTDSRGGYFEEEMDFDIDDASERRMIISYLNTSWLVEMTRAAAGGTWVNFRAERNTQECGRNSIELYFTKNREISFPDCGIVLFANWEGSVFELFETNVAIEKVLILKEEINRIQNDFFKTNNRAALENIAIQTERINQIFRTVELTNKINVINDGVNYIYSTTEVIDEEDSTGKEKSLVVTENQEIKYVLLMPKQFSRVINVYKPREKVLVTELKSFDELIRAVDTKMDPVETHEASQSELEQWLTIGGSGAVAVGAGITTAVVGLGGGAVIATGGTILIAAAAGGGTYYAYQLGDTFTMIADGGGLIFNFDRETLSFNEAKINFIIVPLRAETVSPTTPVTPPSGQKTGALFVLFNGFPSGKTRADVKVSVEGVSSVSTKWFGNKLIIYGLEVGKDYNFELDLSGQIIKQSGKSREWDKGVLDGLP